MKATCRRHVGDARVVPRDAVEPSTGFAAGARSRRPAVITRPALLVAAALIPLTSYRGESRASDSSPAARDSAIGVVVTMAIGNHFFQIVRLFNGLRIGVELVLRLARRRQSRDFPATRLDRGRPVVHPGAHHRIVRIAPGAAIEAVVDLWRGHAAVSPLPAIRPLGNAALPAAGSRSAHHRGRRRVDAHRAPAEEAGGDRGRDDRVHRDRGGTIRNPARQIERVGDRIAGRALSARRRVDQRQHAADQRGDGQSAQRFAALVRKASNDQMGFHPARAARGDGARSAITRRHRLRGARG